MTVIASNSATCLFRIQSRSPAIHERTLAFPCDEHGNVDMDQLSDAGRRDYLFARIMVRRGSQRPAVVPSTAH